MSSGTILVIGALGQIGSDLVRALRARHGNDRVIAADLRHPETDPEGPQVLLNVLDRQALEQIVTDHQVEEIYHLAAILSAKGEQSPIQAWQVNMDGLLNTLEVMRRPGLKRLFWPSSIAVFGPHSAQTLTPQHGPMDPTTVYGISKLAGERWCEYYHQKFGVDVRSLRYPGLISYRGRPGGGTTDYAVDIFHHALRNEAYTCYLRPDSRLPMMYMPDAIRATIELMEAPESSLRERGAYNVAAMSFTPAEIAAELQRQRPGLELRYEPDFRQAIADSWPGSIDDSAARTDWGWQHHYDLPTMTRDMLQNLAQQPPFQLIAAGGKSSN